MKKLLLVLSVLLMVLLVVPSTELIADAAAAAVASPEELTEGFYTYTVTDGEATITGCDTSVSGEVIIPSTLGGYPVTEIGYNAFEDCVDMTGVVIPESVTLIDGWAFINCIGLTDISIPDTVLALGRNVFCSCENLKNVTIGSGITYIPDFTFMECTSLTEITLPSNITYVGMRAFWNCTSLTDVTLNGVQYIDSNAFEGCTDLDGIILPDTLVSIGSGAFRDCTNLHNIVIPDGITHIEASTFYGCTSLGMVDLPDSVTYIDSHAFDGCSSLSVLEIPSDVTYIGGFAFAFCDGLTSITIPDSVTRIGENAFYGCTGLNSITIPDGVTSIRNETFNSCTSLTSITIPDSVTSIGEYAFRSCTSLTSITIPDSVASIGEGAFYGCTGLTSITIPDGVTSIGDWAFFYCTGLTSITIPDSVTSIGEGAFSGCTNLTDVYYGGTAEQWAEIFIDEGDESLANANIHCTVPNVNPNEQYYTYVVNDGRATITGYNSPIGGDVVIPTTLGGYPVGVIGEGSFWNCTNVTGITIPAGVTDIQRFAFQDCTNLTSVTIGYGLVEIDTGAFEDCVGLTTITIPESVTTIADSVFSGCAGLTDVYYGGTTEDWTNMWIGEHNEYLSDANVRFAESEDPKEEPETLVDGIYTYMVFDGKATIIGCEDVISGDIVIPSTLGGYPVAAIGGSAFYSQGELTGVTIPDGVVEIGRWAFGKSNITRVTIPESVTSIGEFAFYFCNNLTVYYSGTEEQWSSINVDANNDELLNATILCNQKTEEPTEELYTYTVTDGKATIIDCDETVIGSITIPATLGGYPVVAIGNEAFKGCANIYDITIPEGVTSIGNSAFAGCTWLNFLVIPDSVTSLGTDAFQDDTYRVIYFDGSKEQWETLENSEAFFGTNVDVYWKEDVFFYKLTEDGNAEIVKCDASATGTVTIPTTIAGYPVVGIGMYAFAWLENVTEVVIPEGVTYIQVNAFDGCVGLESVTLPTTLTEIPSCAFAGCASLTSIVIPENVTIIGSSAFYNCTSLYSVSLPLSLGAIGPAAFEECTSLAEVYYAGSPSKWNMLYIEVGNEPLYNANVYCQGVDCQHIAGDEVIENENPCSCIYDGWYEKAVYCTVCGDCIGREWITLPAPGSHTPGETVIENNFPAGCNNTGSYQKTVYCTACGCTISRELVITPATGHTPGEETVRILNVESCTGVGFNEVVVSCTVCEMQIVHKVVMIPATGHTAGEPVVENEWPAGCTNTGSRQLATYCVTCGSEMNRTTEMIPAKGHTANAPIIENQWIGNCMLGGSYQSVVYCADCNYTISREDVAVAPQGHTPGEECIENHREANCYNIGSYDRVIYCTACGCELSRIVEIIPKTIHVSGETVIENRWEPSCSGEGSYDNVTYCTLCGAQTSRETVVIPALPHTEEILMAIAPDCFNVGWTEGTYCTVCGTVVKEQELVPMLEHIPGEVTVENVWEPTCYREGSCDQITHCSICGWVISSETVTIPKLEHTEGILEAVAPDCFNIGWTEGTYCTVCGTVVVEQELIPQLEHIQGEVTVENLWEPNCLSEGSYDRVTHCSVCGWEILRETVTIPALEHSYTNYIPDGAGNKVASCDNGCGTTDTQIDENYQEPLPVDIVIDEKGYVTLVGEYANKVSKTYVYYVGATGYDGATGDLAVSSSLNRVLLNLGKAEGNVEVNTETGYRVYTKATTPRVTRSADYVFRIVYTDDTGTQKNVVIVRRPGKIQFEFDLQIAEDGRIMITGDRDFITRIYTYYVEATGYDGPTGELAFSSALNKQLLNLGKADGNKEINGNGGYRSHVIKNLPRLTTEGLYVIRLAFTDSEGNARTIIYTKDVQNLRAPASFDVEVEPDGKVTLTGDVDRVIKVYQYYVDATGYNFLLGEQPNSTSLHKNMLNLGKAAGNIEVNGAGGYCACSPTRMNTLTTSGLYAFRIAYTDFDGTLKNYILVKDVELTP